MSTSEVPKVAPAAAAAAAPKTREFPFPEPVTKGGDVAQKRSVSVL